MKDIKKYLISEKLNLNKDINNIKNILVYNASTGDRDNPYATVYIKNTDKDIQDFVTYWWREELPYERPGNNNDDWENRDSQEVRDKYKKYYKEVAKYIKQIKKQSITLEDYFNNIYDELKEIPYQFAEYISNGNDEYVYDDDDDDDDNDDDN